MLGFREGCAAAAAATAVVRSGGAASFPRRWICAARVVTWRIARGAAEDDGKKPVLRGPSKALKALFTTRSHPPPQTPSKHCPTRRRTRTFIIYA